MENVAFAAFGEPKQAFAPVHIVRKSLEEVLESLHGKGLSTMLREY